jgi:hypothetical protein
MNAHAGAPRERTAKHGAVPTRDADALTPHVDFPCAGNGFAPRPVRAILASRAGVRATRAAGVTRGTPRRLPGGPAMVPLPCCSADSPAATVRDAGDTGRPSAPQAARSGDALALVWPSSWKASMHNGLCCEGVECTAHLRVCNPRRDAHNVFSCSILESRTLGGAPLVPQGRGGDEAAAGAFEVSCRFSAAGIRAVLRRLDELGGREVA